MSKRDEETKPDRVPIIAGVGITVVFVGALVVHGFWPHFFGATGADIANVDLSQTPKELARHVPSSTASDSSVKSTFRHSVVGFERATFSWDGGDPDHVSGIKLELEREEEVDKKSEHGDHDWARLFAARLPGFGQDEWKWGAVRFNVSASSLGFRVDKSKSRAFTEQVEAARQILCAVAFGDEPKLSPKQIADALGTGYAVADVASIDVSAPSPTAIDAVLVKFPGALAEKDRVRIPLTHPFLRDVVVRWKTAWNSTAPRIHVDFHMTAAYAVDHKAFAACIAKQPAASELETREQDLDVLADTIQPAFFSSIMQAVDACR